MLEQLKEAVLAANLELPRRGLVTYTWGNVSGICRERGLVVIKPSGVSYEEMKAEDMVVLDLGQCGGRIFAHHQIHNPLAFTGAWPEVGGIVHTHSTYATVWGPGPDRNTLFRNNPCRLFLW